MGDVAKSGCAMPSVPSEGSSSKAIETARQTALDSWHTFGNNTADSALAFDKSTVRKTIDPSSLGPTKP